MKRWEWLNVYIHKQATSQGLVAQCWAIWVDEAAGLLAQRKTRARDVLKSVKFIIDEKRWLGNVFPS